MTPKRRRLTIVFLGLLMLGSATALVLTAFEDNLVFFYSPTELETKNIGPDRRIRIGGLVEEESVGKQADGVTNTFRVTDLTKSVPVAFKGALPDLFREGQGIIAEGRFVKGVFQASEVLAKHDETYMPREVADALKKSGQWKGQGTE
ncbi:MAG: cytochrome c maturation protein CcmE [Rhodospirillaceae bacterium]|nr:cytochrome c maturation protein CcmE [Rhodospirillaceae bacterium]MBT6136598.1 cytochrome c maturation protein CcmE [Rhodospirillaceae bacterium]